MALQISEGLFRHIFFFLVLIGITGETHDKRISEGLFCLLFFCWFWVFRGIIGGPLINVFTGVFFYGFWFFFFVCLVFIGIIGGTPDKRISEGLFRPLFFWLVLGFYRHYRGDH